MSEKKLLDLAKSARDEMGDLALSEVLPGIVKTYGDIFVSESLANLAGELIGAVFPCFNNIRLSYKQNRLERNLSTMLDYLVENQEILKKRLDELEKTHEGRDFLQLSNEMLLDNIVDEIQTSKVQYSVNGYINLIQTEDSNIDMSLMFFKTISALNDIDIRILKTYDLRHPSDTEPITPFNSEFDSSQLRYIKEKLLRLGLLKSRNEEVSTKNQEHIIDYLQKFNKDLNSRKPKGVRLPNFKKIHLSDSYRITSLGGALLQLISEQCDLTDLNTSVDEGEEDFE